MNSICIGFVQVIDNVFFLAEQGDTAIGQQLLHLLDTTAALALFLSNDTSLRLMLATIQAAPATNALREVMFGSLLFQIAGVIDVIAAIPSLESLTCVVGDSDPASRLDPLNLHIRRFRSSRHPLSKNFRVLRVVYTVDDTVEDIARVAMYIAIVCPRFAFVDIPPEHREAFNREIASARVNESFRPFANYISRLIV
ncbi:hypothetical protein GGF41_000626 [Coemansia sp. RSA 2531]|nr:hypothetical protein GGF41_000626 [Coemansia sp. RSA 2531]